MRRLRSGDPSVDLPIHRWSHEHELLEDVEGDWVRELLERREMRDRSDELGGDLAAELRRHLRAQRDT
jgi:hypothetical protein